MVSASYSPALVLISLCVAILASYTALDLSGLIATARGRTQYLWIAGGALAMGFGVWSMHLSACSRCSCHWRWATTWG